MDESVFGKIFSAASGVWALVVMVAVALFRAWPNIMERINERRRDRATEEAGDWQRLREERDRLRCLLTVCEKERIEWMHRAVTAEATLQGYGEAKQRAAEIAALDRLEDMKRRERGNGKK